MVMFSGGDDPLAAPLDVEWLEGQLPNVEHHSVMDAYGHFDFLMGLDAREKVYDEILRRT